MRLLDVAARASGNLSHASTRSLLTVLAISVGAFAMTLGIALNEGGGKYSYNILSANIDPHSLWVSKKQDEKSTVFYPSRYDGNPTVQFQNFSVKPLKDDDLGDIGRVDGVESVEPVYAINDAVISKYGDAAEEYRAVVNVARKGAFRVYVAGDSGELKDDEVILPSGFSEALGHTIPETAIGQKVTLSVADLNGTGKKKLKKIFTVRAVIMQSSLSLYVTPLAVLVSNNTAKELNDFMTADTPQEGSYIGANALVKADSDLETTKQKINAAGYFARTGIDAFSAMYQTVNVLRAVLVIFGIIAVLTAIFGIINTQHISVLERVQEIGLMKSLGMSGRDVGKLFEFEATLMGFTGGCLGAFAATMVGSAINPLISQSLMLDKGNELIIFTPIGTIGVALFLTIISLVAGLVPARLATRIDPVEALRNDSL